MLNGCGFFVQPCLFYMQFDKKIPHLFRLSRNRKWGQFVALSAIQKQSSSIAQSVNESSAFDAIFFRFRPSSAILISDQKRDVN
ncbi:hypothetical protein DD563_06480 [Pelagicola sp. LXJ1103]|nr:hypothetical protein DD563_06480 [Pelagicola sp. LXJ1103]